MLGWKYKLEIGKAWQDRDDEDDDAVAREVAPKIARDVWAFAMLLISDDPTPSRSLEEISEDFECVAEIEQPARMFNYALASLYDLGDVRRILIS